MVVRGMRAAVVACGLMLAVGALAPNCAYATTSDAAPANATGDVTRPDSSGEGHYSSTTIEIDGVEHEKVGTPVPEKWVLEDSTGSWVAAADRSLDETFRYRIDGTMQGDMFDYDQYQWWLVDTLPAGVDLSQGSVEVTLVRADGSERALSGELEVSYADHVLKVGSSDIVMAIEGLRVDDVIRVEYDAKANHDFKVGVSDPNDNLCHIDHTTPITGEGLVSSPEAQARSVTWQLVVAKHDAADAKCSLSGATFELAEAGGRVCATVTTDAQGRASVVGIDSGTYVLRETKAPDGYDKVAPITFEIRPEWDGLELKSLSVSGTKGAKASSDAHGGTVTVEVADTKSAVPGPKGGPGGGSKGGTNPISRVIGSLPKMGDTGVAAGVVVTLVGAGAVALGVGIWRRRRDAEDGDTTSETT